MIGMIDSQRFATPIAKSALQSILTRNIFGVVRTFCLQLPRSISLRQNYESRLIVFSPFSFRLPILSKQICIIANVVVPGTHCFTSSLWIVLSPLRDLLIDTFSVLFSIFSCARFALLLQSVKSFSIFVEAIAREFSFTFVALLRRLICDRIVIRHSVPRCVSFPRLVTQRGGSCIVFIVIIAQKG